MSTRSIQTLKHFYLKQKVSTQRVVCVLDSIEILDFISDVEPIK